MKKVDNVFWVDARRRALYKEFGDALTFDSTYLTNKYDIPFVAFVGVNHHGQSTLFGCGLISNEDTETYIWPFSILANVLTRDELEERWNELINMYGLHNNEWLLRLYDERRRWVPALLKDTFCTGLSTTQCCERHDNWSAKPEGHRFDKMCYELAYLAIGSDDMCNIVTEGITDLKTKLISNEGDNGRSRYIPTLNNDTSKENCNILSPRADFERLDSDRFTNVDVPPNSDRDGNILATQESIMIEPNSQIK
ncbi:hypothetical protein Ddye_021485 [Dipteronia dyeriana]|uniref:Protein FAR1-RELATED SEQUENCE n=1 Tax=Dipteronia dyeriana TaxID=168575 RepID=A0AAD9WY17_9ROSI|nr:hypothetical protein Ddye_021485 [Dipteronia dyeriana]